MNMKFRLLAILLASFFFTNSAFAGDPIPGVDVHLSNTATGAVIHAKTDASGAFTVSLGAGTYTVSVSYAECVKATTAPPQNGTNTPNSGDRRSYTAGKFLLDIDQTQGITVADLNKDGIPDMAISGKRMLKPFTITKEWTASSPGFGIVVQSTTGKKDFTGHVTLIK